MSPRYGTPAYATRLPAVDSSRVVVGIELVVGILAVLLVIPV